MRNKTLLRILVTVTFITCVSPHLLAQVDKNLLLKNYTLPDIQRHALDLMANSNGGFIASSLDDEGSSNATINLNGAYSFYKNTRNFIGQQSLGVSFSGNYYKDKSYDTERGSISPIMSYGNSSRFYKGNIFFETGVSAYVNYNRYYNDDNRDKYTFYTSAAIPLMFGVGRIENVKDMRQAIYIIDNLEKKGVINRSMSADEFNEFARLISTVKNKRFFDSRKRLISEVTALDTFLKSNNIIDEEGASYFTTLYDYWLYGDLFERKSGTEFKVGVIPSGRYNYYNDLASKKHNEDVEILGEISLSYENPSSLSWQHSSLVSVSGGWLRSWKPSGNGDHQFKRTSDETFVKVYGEYYIGYYPNSRTNMNMGVSESFLYGKFKNEYYNEDFNVSVTRLHFDMYYYLSPQLRIAANTALAYKHASEDNVRHNHYPAPIDGKRSWTGEYRVTLTYSLF